jgi:hypothetical protein
LKTSNVPVSGLLVFPPPFKNKLDLDSCEPWQSAVPAGGEDEGMQFSLRTLLILLTVLPPLLAAVLLYPWLIILVPALAIFLAGYLIALPYCIAWIIRGIVALLAKLPKNE